MNRTVEATREMKDSGIEWIGKIPQEWELAPLKAILKERKEKNLPIKTTNILSLTIDKGVIPYSEKSGGGNKAKEDLTAYKLAYPNDIVLNSMNVIAGAVGLSKYFGAISPVYYTLYTNEDINHISYFNNIFQTKDFQKSLMGLGNGIMIKESGSGKLNTIRLRIPMEKLKGVMLPVPPIHEQQAIADYLDGQVEKIDRLISDQKVAIEKWKEYKQSLIIETVTKGLNPHVKMKDSGIEWIGQIPSNWNKMKISNLFTLIGSGTTPTSSDLKYYDDGEIPWLNTGDLNDGYLYTSKNKVTSHALNDYSTLKVYPEDTLIVAMYGATIGKLGITTYKTTTNQACCALSNPKNCITKFIFYWFYGNKTEIINLSRGAGQPNISQNIIKNLILFIPPLHEQQTIADYLDQQVDQIDKTIEQKQQLIKQLEEYKQSLIYECVTGKRCVL